jgi:hypothetical protein
MWLIIGLMLGGAIGVLCTMGLLVIFALNYDAYQSPTVPDQ